MRARGRGAACCVRGGPGNAVEVGVCRGAGVHGSLWGADGGRGQGRGRGPGEWGSHPFENRESAFWENRPGCTYWNTPENAKRTCPFQRGARERERERRGCPREKKKKKIRDTFWRNNNTVLYGSPAVISWGKKLHLGMSE